MKFNSKWPNIIPVLEATEFQILSPFLLWIYSRFLTSLALPVSQKEQSALAVSVFPISFPCSQCRNHASVTTATETVLLYLQRVDTLDVTILSLPLCKWKVPQTSFEKSPLWLSNILSQINECIRLLALRHYSEMTPPPNTTQIQF